MKTEKKVAIVTGAGSGVGRETALKLAKEGYALTVVGRSEANTLETEALIKEIGADVIHVIADVGEEEDTIRYVNETVKQYGKIDVLAHVAARFQPYVFLADTETELFDDIMRINVKGTFLALKYTLKQMEKQGHGVIVAVASTDGLVTDEQHASYSASKHGMVGLIKNAAVEYGPKGIRTNAVCPGSINTKMIADILKDADLSLFSPLQRPAEPGEIADAVCYLASDKASYINGALLRVDGGYKI